MDSLEMILNDHPHLMRETSEGIDRIKKIIRDLKHFSHTMWFTTHKAQAFGQMRIFQA